MVSPSPRGVPVWQSLLGVSERLRRLQVALGWGALRCCSYEGWLHGGAGWGPPPALSALSDIPSTAPLGFCHTFTRGVLFSSPTSNTSSPHPPTSPIQHWASGAAPRHPIRALRTRVQPPNPSVQLLEPSEPQCSPQAPHYSPQNPQSSSSSPYSPTAASGTAITAPKFHITATQKPSPYSQPPPVPPQAPPPRCSPAPGPAHLPAPPRQAPRSACRP